MIPLQNITLTFIWLWREDFTLQCWAVCWVHFSPLCGLQSKIHLHHSHHPVSSWRPLKTDAGQTLLIIYAHWDNLMLFANSANIDHCWATVKKRFWPTTFPNWKTTQEGFSSPLVGPKLSWNNGYGWLDLQCHDCHIKIQSNKTWLGEVSEKVMLLKTLVSCCTPAVLAQIVTVIFNFDVRPHFIFECKWIFVYLNFGEVPWRYN